MSLVDAVWRSITEPVLPPSGDEPELIQVLQYGDLEYPLFIQGSVTRVIPTGGLPDKISAWFLACGEALLSILRKTGARPRVCRRIHRCR